MCVCGGGGGRGVVVKIIQRSRGRAELILILRKGGGGELHSNVPFQARFSAFLPLLLIIIVQSLILFSFH